MSYSPELNSGEAEDLVAVEELHQQFERGIAGVRTANNRPKHQLYYHYTNEASFNQIMESGVKIVPGADGNVYITTHALSPAYAKQALFMGMRGKSASHVVAFSLQAGVPLRPGTQPNELIHRGTMRRPRQIRHVIYAGENPFKD